MTRTTVTLFLMIAGPVTAAEPPFRATLVSATASAPLAERLAEHAKRVGITIDVSALAKDEASMKPLANVAWWDAVKSVAGERGGRIVLEGLGDRIALVPGSSPPDFCAGPFRFVAKSVTAKYDYETGRGGTDVAVDLHWEPRIRVFRSGHVSAVASARGEGDIGGSPRSGAGSGWNQIPPPTVEANRAKSMVTGSRLTFQLRATNVNRMANELTVSQGSITLTAAEKLLRVTFDDITAKNQTQTAERVGVNLITFEKLEDIWEAKVNLDYPPGMPEFESWEAECWLRDNACRLVSPDRTKSFESKDFRVKVTANGATIDYRFPEDRAKGLLPGKGWRLEVDTPSPLVEFPLAFELKGIRLP